MTVTVSPATVTYNGNGSQTAFPFTFMLFAETDIEVIQTDSASVETVKTITTHYTVSAGPWTTGGTVTMLVAPPSGQTLTLRQNIPATQPLDYTEGSKFPAASHEQGLDRLTLLVQAILRDQLRALIVPKSESVSAGDLELPPVVDRADMFLAFDADGLPIAAAGTSSDLGPVTAFINTILDDADAATVIETLRGNLAAETAPAIDDEVLLRDTSATTGKRMTLANLLKVVSALTAETAPATDDELLLYDLSAGTADKITLANLLKVVNALTADASPDVAADYLLSYDASATAAKKILLNTLIQGQNIGAATATTPPRNDNDTSVATSAFVKDLAGGVSTAISVMKCGCVNISQGVTRYLTTIGLPEESTEANTRTPIASPTEVYQLDVVFSEAIPAGQSATITLRKNGADTAITQAIAGPVTAGVVTSLTGSVVYAKQVGGVVDDLSVKIVTSASFGTTNDVNCAIRLRVPNSNNRPVSNLSFKAASVANFCSVGEFGAYRTAGSAAVVASDARAPISETIRKSLTQKATTTASPLIYGSATVTVADDYFPANTGFSYVKGDSTAELVDGYVVLSDDQHGNQTGVVCPILCSSEAQAQNTTAYLGGYLGNENTAFASVAFPLPAGKLKNLRARSADAVPGGQTVVLEIYVDIGAGPVATGITLTLDNSNQQAADTTHTYNLSDKGLVAVRQVNSATTGNITVNASFELEKTD